MLEKPKVILDKNFLQGSSTHAIGQLQTKYSLAMPDVLFYEIMSSDVKERAACFRHLPPCDNPVLLFPRVGQLLRKEIDTQMPCGLPSVHAVDVPFRFNPALVNVEYELPKEAQETLDVENAEVKNAVAEMVERINVTRSMFVNLFKGSDNDRRRSKADAELAIATDQSIVLSMYDSFEAPEGEPPFPPAKLLGPDWALYRWLQIQLMLAVDLCSRYPAGIPITLSESQLRKLENHMHDAEYVILAVLEGCPLATRDENIRRLFSVIYPGGKLIT